MKILTVVGTRPEVIRLSRVISCLSELVDHVLVHTGQNNDFELNEIFFEELGISQPDYFLNSRGENAIQTISNVITKVDEILEETQPDAVLVLGDTNSALSVLSAKRRKIPIFHMEAGNRCFDQRVPEEVNRKIVDHLSDVNMTYTEHARRNLLAEGFPTDRLFKTGSPQHEILEFYKPLINTSSIKSLLGVSDGRYFVASIHREENVDVEENLRIIVKSLNLIVKKFGHPVLFSVHPRTKLRLNALKEKLDDGVVVLKPLGLPDYVRLQRDSFCVLSDSGTITEEASLLGFPAINLRETHERPEGVDDGVLVMTGVDQSRIIKGIEVARCEFEKGIKAAIPLDYLVENVSWKVTKIILSYTDYVNRNVWHR